MGQRHQFANFIAPYQMRSYDGKRFTSSPWLRRDGDADSGDGGGGVGAVAGAGSGSMRAVLLALVAKVVAVAVCWLLRRRQGRASQQRRKR
jgi:hypothetical protein